MRAKFAFLGALLLIGSGQVVEAGRYEYHDSLPFAGFGDGYDPQRPTEVLSPCVSVVADTSPVNSSAQLTVKLLRSRDDFYRHLHLSLEAEATYVATTGSVDGTFDREVSFEDNKVVWIVSHVLEWPAHNIKSWTYNDQGMQVGPSFVERCGREFVSSMSKGAVAAAVYSLTISNQNERQTVEAAVSGSTSGVEMSGALKDIVKRARSRSSLSIRLIGRGGADESLFTRTLTDTTLESAQQELKKYADTFSWANAAVFSYGTTAFPQSRTSLPPLPTIDPRLPHLVRLWDQYRQLTGALVAIDKINSVEGRARWHGILAPSTIEKYTRMGNEYPLLQKKLIAALNQCLGSTCESVAPPSEIPLLSDIPPIPALYFSAVCATNRHRFVSFEITVAGDRRMVSQVEVSGQGGKIADNLPVLELDKDRPYLWRIDPVSSKQFTPENRYCSPRVPDPDGAKGLIRGVLLPARGSSLLTIRITDIVGRSMTKNLPVELTANRLYDGP